jgi:hypothetical protein
MSWRVAKSLDVLLGEINARAPKRSKVSDGSIGDAAHASRSSDHNPWVIDDGVGVVRARDFTHDPANGLDCNVLARELAALLGKHPALGRDAYIIWNDRIVSTNRLAEGWRDYTGSNPHTKHLHVSVTTNEAGFDSLAPWLTKPPRPIVHRVAGFNLHAPTVDSCPRPRRRIRKLTRALRERWGLGPEAIALQEIHTARKALRRLVTYKLITKGRDGGRLELGVLLKRGRKVIDVEYHHAADGVGDAGPKHHPRGILVVKYKKRGRKVAVVNTHCGFDAAQNRAHVALVCEIAERLLSRGYVVFVAADANSAIARMERALTKRGFHVQRDGVDLLASSLPLHTEPSVPATHTGSDHPAITARTEGK